MHLSPSWLGDGGNRMTIERNVTLIPPSSRTGEASSCTITVMRDRQPTAFDPSDEGEAEAVEVPLQGLTHQPSRCHFHGALSKTD